MPDGPVHEAGPSRVVSGRIVDWPGGGPVMDPLVDPLTDPLTDPPAGPGYAAAPPRPYNGAYDRPYVEPNAEPYVEPNAEPYDRPNAEPYDRPYDAGQTVGAPASPAVREHSATAPSGDVGDAIGDGKSGGYGSSERTPKPPRSRGRKLVLLVLTLLVALAAVSASGYVWADYALAKGIDLGAVKDRPAPGRGTNYLIVGSDSREGMSAQDRKTLHTGGSADAGRRTDSMMLLHTGAQGTTMVSLPRDSWMTVPSYVRPDTGVHYPARKNKLNAAFSLGGAPLLVRTVEANTGLRIDHYAEIGFSGFVGIVNAVGGVPMCLDHAVHDPKSGLDLTKGCHTLDGRGALAFVRQRHQEKEGDLGRTRNQQKFLAALAQRAASSDVLSNPGKAISVASTGLGALTVDNDTHPQDLVSVFRVMRGGPGLVRLNIPVTGRGLATSSGSAVEVDWKPARKVFAQLKEDRPVAGEGGR
ncbi:LCP family protein [Streptomyces sp. NPDC058221]|uniref:LCP family glycopolymer transferase n=1 Tax=Streptomyces sp. NPDC058221 TaxID=3346388 RepID=UPI0036E544AA